MKIAIVTTTFPRFDEDIIPPFVFGLARAMVEEGAEVLVIAPHDHPPDLPNITMHEWRDGVEIRRMPYWLPLSAQGLCYGNGIPTNVRRKKWVAMQLPTLIYTFVRGLIRYAPDADIYNPHWTFGGVGAVIASKFTRKPIVTHAYSAEYVTSVLLPANRWIVNNSDSIICNSEFTRQKVSNVVQTPQLHVIGSGVNHEKIATPDLDVGHIRNRLQIKPSSFFILAVGRLVERKGYHVLIESIRYLKNEERDVQLIIVGTGPEQENLSRQITQSGLEDYIELGGYVPDNDLKDYIAASDVLVMPSVIDRTGDTEGLGIPVLEGMANRTVVVASAIGGLLDLVQHEKNGLLVESGDPVALAKALMRLCDDPQLRQSLLEGGTKFIEDKYSWSTLAQQTLAVYENAITSHR